MISKPLKIGRAIKMGEFCGVYLKAVSSRRQLQPVDIRLPRMISERMNNANVTTPIRTRHFNEHDKHFPAQLNTDHIIHLEPEKEILSAGNNLIDGTLMLFTGNFITNSTLKN